MLMQLRLILNQPIKVRVLAICIQARPDPIDMPKQYDAVCYLITLFDIHNTMRITNARLSTIHNHRITHRTYDKATPTGDR